MRQPSRLRRLMFGCVLAAGIASSAACAEPRGRLYVRVGPPAPIYEVRVTAPGPGYIWLEGYQRWDGGRYVWVPGHWERPPHRGARWETGHWSRDSRGWFYVEGRWR